MNPSQAIASLQLNENAPNEFDKILIQFISTLNYSPSELSSFSEDDCNFSKLIQYIFIPTYRNPFVMNQNKENNDTISISNSENPQVKTGNFPNNQNDLCPSICIKSLINMCAKNPNIKRIAASIIDFDILTQNMIGHIFSPPEKKISSRSDNQGDPTSKFVNSRLYNFTRENIRNQSSKPSLISNGKSEVNSVKSSTTTESNNSNKFSENLLTFMKLAAILFTDDHLRKISVKTIHLILSAIMLVIDERIKEIQITPDFGSIDNSKSSEDSELDPASIPTCCAWSIATLTSLYRTILGASSIIVSRQEFAETRSKLAYLLGSNNPSEVVSAISAIVTLYPNTLYNINTMMNWKKNKRNAGNDDQLSISTALEIAMTAFRCGPFEKHFPVAYKLATWIILDISEFPQADELGLGYCEDSNNSISEEIQDSKISPKQILDLFSLVQNGGIRAFEIFELLSDAPEFIHDHAISILTGHGCYNLFSIISNVVTAESSFVTVAACNLLNILFPFGTFSLKIEEKIPRNPKNNSKYKNKETLISKASKAFVSCLNVLLAGCITIKTRNPSFINNNSPVINFSSLLKREAAASMLGLLCQIEGAAVFAINYLQKCESKLFLDFERQISANNSFLSVSYFLFLYSASLFFSDWRQKLANSVLSTQFTALLANVITASQNRIAISKALQVLIITTKLGNPRFDNSIIFGTKFHSNENETKNVTNQNSSAASDSYCMNYLVESPFFNSIIDGFYVSNTAKHNENRSILYELQETKQNYEMKLDSLKTQYTFNHEEAINEVNSLKKKLEETETQNQAITTLTNEKIAKLEEEAHKLRTAKQKLETKVSSLLTHNQAKTISRSSSRSLSSSRTSSLSGSPIYQKNTNIGNNSPSIEQNTQFNDRNAEVMNTPNDNNGQMNKMKFTTSTELRLKNENRLVSELKQCKVELTKYREETLREGKAVANLRHLLDKSKKENSQLKRKLSTVEQKCSYQESKLFELSLNNEQLKVDHDKMMESINKLREQKVVFVPQEEEKKDDNTNELLEKQAKEQNEKVLNLNARIEELENQLNDYRMLLKLIHKTTDGPTDLPPTITDFMTIGYQVRNENPSVQ